MADWVGQHIDDYRLTRPLGRGSFGEVYLGEHVDDQTLVAVKMLSLNEEKLSQDKLEEFVKEASTAFRLKHAHIISLLAFGLSADSIPYLVMDYAPNGTLLKRHPKGTQLSLDTIVGYLLPLAEALQYAHDRRVIHRDVKPENVLIGQDGRILLSDFGVAVMAPIERSLSTQNAGGTPVYMAPEQIGGKPQPASDQYALGIMAYEWLCGVRPFQGSLWEILDQHRSQQPPPLCEKLPDLPPMVEEIIFKALAKKPQERFACVQDFATALQQAIHGEKSSSPVPSSGLALAPSSTDVSLQLGQVSDISAIPQAGQVPRPTNEPLVGTNPALSMTVPAGSVSLLIASSSISSLHAQKLVFDSSMSPAIRQTPMSKKLVVFVGLILVMVGSSVFFSPAVINGLKNAPFAITPTIVPRYVTATAAVHAYAAGTMKSGVMFGFDAAHTHWNPYEKVLSRTNVSHLKLIGSYAAATGGEIAVANGVVYVGSYDGNLYAFDGSCRSGCQPLATSDRIISSPAVANGVVYVGSGSGKLYAFDGGCRSGCQPLWSSTTGGVIESSPAVANGVVYVGSGSGKLYAFDGSCRSECQPLWSYATGDWISSSPAVANGVVYVGSNDKKLYAFGL